MSVFYSIIIPAYNAEKYIEQCIRSVLAQTCTDYEIFVIDDGSEDRTGDIIKEMAEVDPASRCFLSSHSPLRRWSVAEQGAEGNQREVCDLSGCG